jgi:hypothetical protein
MGKYEALHDFLTRERATELPMSFSDVERVLSFRLPRSAREYRAWWANEEAGSHSHARAWIEAGYQTADVDMAGERLVFRRAAGAAGPGTPARKRGTFLVNGHHPVFARMAGTVTIPDDFDATEPADPKWGQVAYGNASWDDEE